MPRRSYGVGGATFYCRVPLDSGEAEVECKAQHNIHSNTLEPVSPAFLYGSQYFEKTGKLKMRWLGPF